MSEKLKLLKIDVAKIQANGLLPPAVKSSVGNAYWLLVKCEKEIETLQLISLKLVEKINRLERKING